MLKILGYPDRWSVAPGETIRFMVSEEDGQPFDAQVVRVVCGDCNPAGPGLKLPVVAGIAKTRHAGERQTIDAGSYMTAPGIALAGLPWTFIATIWPTRPGHGDQVIAAQWDGAAQRGFKLVIGADRRLAVISGVGEQAPTRVSVDHPLLQRQWVQVGVSWDGDAGRFAVWWSAVARHALTPWQGAGLGGRVAFIAATEAFTLAGATTADGSVGEHFDGKIEHPMLLSGVHELDACNAVISGKRGIELVPPAAVIAHWDFSREMQTTRAVDVGPLRHHGRLINLPGRAMKGSNWTGEWHDWRQRPEHYAAIHFHHDDLYDAGWQPSLELVIPDGLESGAYALHVSSGASDETATREAYLPFFVRPPRQPAKRAARKSPPKVAFLAPTCAYMAYANHAEHITAREAERTVGRLLEFGHADLYMYDHPELGGSLYDSHLDGSGVAISSRLRPVLNFSSRYHSWLGGAGSALWQYNADTHIFDWLDHQGIAFDVITDEDLHQDGFALLRDYRVILTGTHPEYHSTPMWDAMRDWQDQGGRLIYLGANGWYWRIAFHPELPGVIEVRRAEDGIRTWAAEPGEYHHAFTGEFGGLWRRIGRPPNVVVGVGFMAQGFDVSSYYRRAPDADNPRAAFIFDGVPDQIIGDFGLIGGGAAGLELDAITTTLGSPPNTLRLATSEGHSALVALVNEEFGVVPPALGGDQNDRVRADLAFFETPSGGAVFSVSSIAWAGSLSHNGYANNVSKITLNVLRRFMDAKPFPVR